MNDVIRIHELELFARIGVTAGEREKAQRLLVCVEMEMDLSRAGASDRLEDTVDYAAIAEELSRVAEQREWCLIETLATAMAQRILLHAPVGAATVEIRKFILPQTRYVAVRINRRRNE